MLNTVEKIDLAAIVGQMSMNPGCEHVAVNALVSPQDALEIVKAYNYENQRPLSRRNVSVLAETIRRGEFREYSDVHFAYFAGLPHLINGQHTLHALAIAGKELKLTIHLQRASSKADIESQYGKFDRNKTRSLRDSMGSIGQELELKTKERDALAVAVSRLHANFRPTNGRDSTIRAYESKDYDLTRRLMREWSVEARAYFDLISKANKENMGGLLRAAVVAVGLVTLRYQPEKATEFWMGAAMDDGLRAADPRKTLLSWLRLNPVSKANYVQHRGTTACWNAWFEGRQLQRVYPDTDAALQVNGTPISFFV